MEKYEKAIEDILKSNSIQNSEIIIKKFLKNDLQVQKITKEQYDELTNFLEKKIKQIKENKIQQSVQENKIISIDSRERFQQKIKVQQNEEILFTPIYKGKMGVIAPSRENKDKQKEAR